MAKPEFNVINQLIRDAADQGAAAENVPVATIEQFLRTGEQSWINAFGPEAIKQADAAKTAIWTLFNLASQRLPSAVRLVPPVAPQMIRGRIEPMIMGLVQSNWQETALREIAARTFVLNFQGTRAAIDAELATCFLGEAWQVLWAFLDDHGLKPTEIEVAFEGLSAGAYAHIRWSALNAEDPYSDVVVHEGAHLLHYLKPAQFGLSIRRGQERFVDVDFRQRELFAFTCEAYSRIILQHDRRGRIAFAEKMREDAISFPEEYLDSAAALALSAAKARNGWKIIREGTESPRPQRRHVKSARSAA